VSRKSHWFALNHLYEQLWHLAGYQPRKHHFQCSMVWAGMWQLTVKAAEARLCWRKLFSFPHFNVDTSELLLRPAVKHIAEAVKDVIQVWFPFGPFENLLLRLYDKNSCNALPRANIHFYLVFHNLHVVWHGLWTARIAILIFCLLLRLSWKLFLEYVLPIRTHQDVQLTALSKLLSASSLL